MSDRPFVHLHCHSHYSLLDGAGSIDRLIERAQHYGMNALALTDHGNLHGALEFYKKAKAAGIKPIIGYEAYIAPGSRREKNAGNMKEASYHLTLLCQNRTGFKNLLSWPRPPTWRASTSSPASTKSCWSSTRRA